MSKTKTKIQAAMEKVSEETCMCKGVWSHDRWAEGKAPEIVIQKCALCQRAPELLARTQSQQAFINAREAHIMDLLREQQRLEERGVELLAENQRLTKPVQVHIGKSALSKDLVWCECRRGLSLTGHWQHCPTCGHPINQESYRAAVELAKKNGAMPFAENSEQVAELLRERDALVNNIVAMSKKLGQQQDEVVALRAVMDTMLKALRGAQKAIVGDWPLGHKIDAAISEAEKLLPQVKS